MKRLFFVIFLALSFQGYRYITNAKEKKSATIVIDAGHGGNDVGVINKAANLNEKDLTLSIAQKIKELSKNRNLNIDISRTGDQFIQERQRITDINLIKPDLLISLHAKIEKAEGPEFDISYSTQNRYAEQSAEFGYLIGKSLSSNENIKLKKLNADNSTFLNKVNCPAIIISFNIDNSDHELNYFSKKENCELLAATIVKAIESL